MIGVFLALDTFLFYIFWEVVLVPMYLIIGIWGGANRIYATIKFVLYTLVGSLLMLVAHPRHRVRLPGATAASGRARSTSSAPRVRGTTGFADGLQLLELRCLLPGLRDQGPDVPVPHLAARRPRRGADGGLGDPGRRPAQARWLRAHPVLPAALPRRRAHVRAADHRAEPDRDHLRRDRGASSSRTSRSSSRTRPSATWASSRSGSSCSRSRGWRARSSR